MHTVVKTKTKNCVLFKTVNHLFKYRLIHRNNLIAYLNNIRYAIEYVTN